MLKYVGTIKNSAALEVMEQLISAGYEAYLVGGCVRDSIPEMKKNRCSWADIDIATDALPENVKNVFAHKRTVDTGIRHGTVTVFAGNENIPVEITTYRAEKGYSDGRHPDDVKFISSIREDLKRRDFTINAMAMDIRGNIVDPFGGIEDIRRRMIRTVGDPHDRFKEDALRIMRALRFSSVLGFQIDVETVKAAEETCSMLHMISPERIWDELGKLIVGKHAGDTIREYTEVLGEILPELLSMKGFDQHNEYHKYDVLEHCIRTMESVETNEQNIKYMKIAALFHDIGKPLTYSDDDSGRGHFFGHAAVSSQVADRILERFRVDRHMAERIHILIRHHDIIFERDAGQLKKLMNRFTPGILLEILYIKRADNMATGNMSIELMKKFDDIEKMIRDILVRNECFSLGMLSVNGRDIRGLGIEEGPEIGRILNELLELVIEDRAPNEKEPLLEIAKNIV